MASVHIPGSSHPAPQRPPRRLMRMAVLALASCLGLAACGAVKPATPGNEPPTGGAYNPISGERNSSSH